MDEPRFKETTALPRYPSIAAHPEAWRSEVSTRAAPIAVGSAVGVPIPSSRTTALSKRALDVCGALVGLVGLSPLLVLVWLLIKWDSPGPAIYVQNRVGQGGRSLKMLKFRTMFEGNSCNIHRQYVTRLIEQAPADPESCSGSYKIENDPRVTRFGRILRRTSIAALPQLFNVFCGDMSLVGPRPPLDYEVELYSPRDVRRLQVFPGMTGLWQVSGRSRLTFDEMVDLDLEYIAQWSFWLDVQILWRTVSVVLGRKGAW